MIQIKEETEWCNMWYDLANEHHDDRILIIGDSLARHIRRPLSELSSRPVDLFASSAGLRDPMFWNQLECFFHNSLCHYDRIIVWLGFHCRTSLDGVSPMTEEDFIRFEANYEKLLRTLQPICGNILLLSPMHVYKDRRYNKVVERVRRILRARPAESVDTELSAIMARKNEIVRSLAASHGLRYHDIDRDMMASPYWHRDMIHYIPESHRFTANVIYTHLGN